MQSIHNIGLTFILAAALAIGLATNSAVNAALLDEVEPGTPIAVADDATCRFVFGFATLHDLIPTVAGDCVENESHNTPNGDGLQHTTKGLMVWRKADNFTAFTDGFLTWVNGPQGLQERLNSERLAWEYNPEGLPITPSLAAGNRCHTAQLSLAVQSSDAGAGNVFTTFRFTNNADTSCTFFGYPGAQLLDAAGNPLPTKVVRNGGQLSNQPGPSQVIVPSGESTTFLMHWGQIEVGNETSCPVAGTVLVTPPDEFVPIPVQTQIRACGGGTLDVSAVGTSGPR